MWYDLLFMSPGGLCFSYFMFSLCYYDTFGYYMLYVIETNSNRQYSYMLSNIWIDSMNMHSETMQDFYSFLFSEELRMITEMLVFTF